MKGVALLLEDLALCKFFLRAGSTKAGRSIKSASGLSACGDWTKTIFPCDRDGVCALSLGTGEEPRGLNDVSVGLSSDGFLE